MLFLADASGSIGSVDFDKLRTVLRNLVADWSIGAAEIRVGLMIFSSSTKMVTTRPPTVSRSRSARALTRRPHGPGRGARTQVSSGFESSKERISSIIASMPYDAGSTATGPGIRAAMGMITDYGGNAAVPKAIARPSSGP